MQSKFTISNTALKRLKKSEYKCYLIWFVAGVKVPVTMAEMQAPSVGLNWLKYLENKRMQLLQLVSLEQFKITQSYLKSSYPFPIELFPLYDVLEHRYSRPDRWGF